MSRSTTATLLPGSTRQRAGVELAMPSRRRLTRGVLGIAAVGVAGSLTSCGLAGGEDRTITMIVTESGPFQGPTEIVQDLLEEDGWTLETTYVTDIIQPNQAVSQGEYDVNYFQHLAYLKQFNDDNDLAIDPLFSVFQAPAGLYSEQHDSLEDLPDGAQIALPVDTANNGRGLKMLHDEGLLEVDESAEITELSQSDIESNPHDFEFIEVDQQSLAQTLPDVDAGFSFTRLIAESTLDVDAEDPLIIEDDAEAQLPFTVVIAAAEDFEEQEPEKAEALREAYQSPEVQEWFDSYIGGLKNTAFDIDIDEVWEDFNAS